MNDLPKLQKIIMFVTIGLAVFSVIFCTIVVIISFVNQQNKAKAEAAVTEYTRDELIVSPEKAFNLLREGNQRVVNDKPFGKDLTSEKRETLVRHGQHPFAVILSCSDSRVPPEIIFDQALGDLFVVRDAGNVVDPVTLGSIEYGVEHLKAPLIVVLGHEGCGAVKATIDGGKFSDNIKSIAAKIKPSLDIIKKKQFPKDMWYTETEDENIKNMVSEIEKSKIVEELVKEGDVKVIGAKYDLDTGEVKFNEEVQTDKYETAKKGEGETISEHENTGNETSHENKDTAHVSPSPEANH